MSSISNISSNSSAWAGTGATRTAPKDKLFSLVDSDHSGGVDATELQTLMDEVSKKTGVANSNTAADLVTKLDKNGDGTLDASELHGGITSIVQLPSTMEFAQTRTANSNSDGSLNSSDFATPVDKMSASGGQNATGSSDTTTYDPLDTNKDGVVSAAEAAAGQANGATDTLQSLLKAMDTNKDGTLSNSEADTFVQQVSAAIDTLQKSSSSTDSIDVNQVAQQVLKQYTQMAAGSTSTAGSTVSFTA